MNRNSQTSVFDNDIAFGDIPLLDGGTMVDESSNPHKPKPLIDLLGDYKDEDSAVADSTVESEPVKEQAATPKQSVKMPPPSPKVATPEPETISTQVTTQMPVAPEPPQRKSARDDLAAANKMPVKVKNIKKEPKIGKITLFSVLGLLFLTVIVSILPFPGLDVVFALCVPPLAIIFATTSFVKNERLGPGITAIFISFIAPIIPFFVFVSMFFYNLMN